MDRAPVVAAKVDRLAEVVADADDLKATPKGNRPGEAPLDEVRAAYRDATNEVAGPKASVAEVEGIDLPSERLE